MCLRTVDKKEVTEKIKATIPEDGLTVYKVVEVGGYKHNNEYFPLFQWTHIPFKKGRDEANTDCMISTNYSGSYQSGFHFWLTRKAAIRARGEIHSMRTAIIECIVKKSWITSTGQNDVGAGRTRKTIVANKAIFPEYEDGN